MPPLLILLLLLSITQTTHSQQSPPPLPPTPTPPLCIPEQTPDRLTLTFIPNPTDPSLPIPNLNPALCLSACSTTNPTSSSYALLGRGIRIGGSVCFCAPPEILLARLQEAAPGGTGAECAVACEGGGVCGGPGFWSVYEQPVRVLSNETSSTRVSQNSSTTPVANGGGGSNSGLGGLAILGIVGGLLGVVVGVAGVVYQFKRMGMEGTGWGDQKNERVWWEKIFNRPYRRNLDDDFNGAKGLEKTPEMGI
ncbi:hypothetical protein HDV05_002632, partial [Chytridiales sp. JEL 0842]